MRSFTVLKRVGFLVIIQLFRERLSEKVHATIPKGIVGGFEFSVLQKNLKDRSSGEKLVKYQATSSCVIMFVILKTTLFYKALILPGEI